MPNLEEILKIFEKCYSRKTSAFEALWNRSNISFGHCFVATYLLYEYFGGQIIKFKILKPWNNIIKSHYCLQLDGKIIDPTKEQFPKDFPYNDMLEGKFGVKYTSPKVIKRFLTSNQRISEKYRLFKVKVEQVLKNPGKSF